MSDEVRDFGRQVQLFAPQFVKPFSKLQKNDANDAEAMCEVVSHPNMSFVPDIHRTHKVGASES